MNKAPLIHVILCTFQGEKFIAEQLESIVNQSYSNFEIHVFDDCSTDKTCGIVNSFCQDHLNITLHENSYNLGFLGNFERAISVVSGSYIALSDQDDIWHKDKLLLSMTALEEVEKQCPCKPVLVHSDLSYIDETGGVIMPSFFDKKGLNFPDNKSLSLMLGHCGVMGNTILMNQYLVRKALPFPEGLRYHDYWLAVVNELFGVRKTLNKPLVSYRIHSDNTSGNNRIIKLHKKGFKKRADLILPFMDDSREIALQKLLSDYKITSEDYHLIQNFCDYLTFSGGKWQQYFFLLKSGFLKKGIIFRLTTLYRMLFTTHYGR